MSAGLQAHRADAYWNKLNGVRLIFDDGAKWQLHPDLAGATILGPTPRRTSSGQTIQAAAEPVTARPPASFTAPATDKQRMFIADLLQRQGVTLRDFYPVTDLSEPSRLDAQLLIDGLKDHRPFELHHWQSRWATYFVREQTP